MATFFEDLKTSAAGIQAGAEALPATFQGFRENFAPTVSTFFDASSGIDRSPDTPSQAALIELSKDPAAKAAYEANMARAIANGYSPTGSGGSVGS